MAFDEWINQGRLGQVGGGVATTYNSLNNPFNSATNRPTVAALPMSGQPFNDPVSGIFKNEFGFGFRSNDGNRTLLSPKSQDPLKKNKQSNMSVNNPIGSGTL